MQGGLRHEGMAKLGSRALHALCKLWSGMEKDCGPILLMEARRTPGVPHPCVRALWWPWGPGRPWQV